MGDGDSLDLDGGPLCVYIYKYLLSCIFKICVHYVSYTLFKMNNTAPYKAIEKYKKVEKKFITQRNHCKPDGLFISVFFK